MFVMNVTTVYGWMDGKLVWLGQSVAELAFYMYLLLLESAIYFFLNVFLWSEV